MTFLEIFENIIRNVLMALYQEFWASLFVAFILMFLYKEFKNKGIKQTIKKWFKDFRQSRRFRFVFYFFFILSMILFRTIFCRPFKGWDDTLGNVFGIWTIVNDSGAVNTEGLENIVLFIPLFFTGFVAFKEKIFQKFNFNFISTFGISALAGLTFSLTIELLQLFFKIGDFQISDIVFNTLGAIIGGIIYFIAYKIVEKIRTKKQ